MQNDTYFTAVEQLGRLYMAKVAGVLTNEEFEKLGKKSGGGGGGVPKPTTPTNGTPQGGSGSGSGFGNWVKDVTRPLRPAWNWAKRYPGQTAALGTGTLALGYGLGSSGRDHYYMPRPYGGMYY